MQNIRQHFLALNTDFFLFFWTRASTSSIYKSFFPFQKKEETPKTTSLSLPPPILENNNKKNTVTQTNDGINICVFEKVPISKSAYSASASTTKGISTDTSLCNFTVAV